MNINNLVICIKKSQLNAYHMKSSSELTQKHIFFFVFPIELFVTEGITPEMWVPRNVLHETEPYRRFIADLHIYIDQGVILPDFGKVCQNPIALGAHRVCECRQIIKW